MIDRLITNLARLHHWVTGRQLSAPAPYFAPNCEPRRNSRAEVMQFYLDRASEESPP